MAAVRTYALQLVINETRFIRVAIDDHYEEAHSDHMDDFVILELVKLLNYQTFEAVREYEDGLKVFVVEPLVLNQKPYRLVWFYYKGSKEIVVRTAFRTRRRK